MKVRARLVLALVAISLAAMFGSVACGGGDDSGGGPPPTSDATPPSDDAVATRSDASVDDGSPDSTLANDAGDSASVFDSPSNEGGELTDASDASSPSTEASAELPNGPAGPAFPPTAPYDIYAATQFLYTGAGTVQTGVTSGTIVPRLVAVLRGMVTARDGTPLPGATVHVLNRAEFGATTSQASGVFDLVVNGGQPLVVQIELAGYLTAQRSFTPATRDFTVVDATALVPLDPKVTTVNLSSATMQVAVGSMVQDQSGPRQSILMFPSGTQATMALADGGTASLTTLNVRSTEFTVGATGPQAMPGTLPATSAYTYATELTVDEALNAGATGVTFSQPVAFYVDNIVGFTAGNAVPTGYYDRAQSKWIASDNGLVVKIVAVMSGVASLDVDGSGTAATQTTLTSLGITADELTSLGALHKAGDSLWRVPIKHFTPWDCNWGDAPPSCASYPDGTQFDPGCTSPGPLAPPPNPNQKNPCDHDEEGSIIGCESQTLGEAVGVAGTPFFLRYDTGRAKSFADRFSTTIPLTNATLPPGLKRVQYDVKVVGRDFQGALTPPTPNASVAFTWDGLDAYGRAVTSAVPAQITVSYVYPGIYLTPAREQQASFGNIVDLSASGDPSRDELTLDGPTWTVWFGVASYESQFGDGWSLSSGTVKTVITQ
jgi:hypothetical protein